MAELPRLIGLAGHAGVGKDTLGDELMKRHGFIKFSFSDALYGEVSAAFGMTVEQLQDRSTKEINLNALALQYCRDEGFLAALDAMAVRYPPANRFAPRSPREILQLWGTEYRRAKDPDYWLKRAQRFYDERIAAGVPGLVNTSVRFRNEALWVKGAGGFLARIARAGHHGINGHVSEADVTGDLMQGILNNDATPTELYSKLINLIQTCPFQPAGI